MNSKQPTKCYRNTLRQFSPRRGATAVEMAIVVPFFFLLVFGLVEFARMTMVQQALTDAARAGCRKAVLANTINQADAESTARDYLHAAVEDSNDEEKCRVLVAPNTLDGMASGTDITTTVEIDYADVSWIPPIFLSNVVLRGEATMTRE